MRFHWALAGAALALAALPGICPALDKPTGNPLVMSDIETEQPIPLAYVSPDGRTVSCSLVKIHWSPAPSTSAGEAATVTLDLAADKPGAATFTAQFWNASLAGSLAWQKPWQGAHWKIIDTPATDGTGIDAGLAVGMVATSARRPYPKDTLVIGNMHPDSSLGKVSRLVDRIDAAAKAGVARVIIPKVQQFETEPDGSTVNIVHHAEELNLKCIPVDTIVEAIEVTMNDPLPDPPTGSGPPKYSLDVAAYIDRFAQREQAEAASGLLYAPKEAQLAQYPPRQAAVWRQVYAEMRQGQEAYKSGKVYIAYRLLARANSRMRGLNALGSDQLGPFDVKSALATSDQLQAQVHYLMTPPVIDHAELQSAMLISEMADWAYDIEASLEGSELVTKQAFSPRSDASPAERDRAREAIISANEEAKYLLQGSNFFTGLLPHLGEPNPLPANSNAMNLLPQLIPAQLATAQIFADGIKPQVNDLRVMMLFDPRLAAYVNVLLKEKAQFDASERRRQNAQFNAAQTNSAPNVVVNDPGATNAVSTNAAPPTATPLISTNDAGDVGFKPNDMYAPPHNEVDGSTNADAAKKLSDVAQCLIWVNTDCEIATLDQKYLRLDATTEPSTHEWKLKDRGQLDALLQLAERGALQGAAFAQQAEVSPSIFGMIYERANFLRLHGDDTNGLAGLRNYWRCALLGNMCWQLAHTHKAAAVDLGADDKKGKEKKKTAETNAVSTNSVVATNTNHPSETTNSVTTPAAVTNAPSSVAATTNGAPATNAISDVPPVPPVENLDSNSPPIAPIAKAADLVTNVPPLVVSTNVPPSPNPVEPRALPVEISTNTVTVPADTNQAPIIGPVPRPATPTDDEYTGGNAGAAAPRALPVSPTTNAPSSIQ